MKQIEINTRLIRCIKLWKDKLTHESSLGQLRPTRLKTLVCALAHLPIAEQSPRRLPLTSRRLPLTSRRLPLSDTIVVVPDHLLASDVVAAVLAPFMACFSCLVLSYFFSFWYCRTTQSSLHRLVNCNMKEIWEAIVNIITYFHINY
jgi:hypothetical protein